MFTTKSLVDSHFIFSLVFLDRDRRNAYMEERGMKKGGGRREK